MSDAFNLARLVGAGAPVFTSVAAARAMPVYGAPPPYVITLGAVSPAAGGGGIWRWDAASTASDTTGAVFALAAVAGAGRYVCEGMASASIRAFGAVGDGVTDDASACQAAADHAAANGLFVVAEPGTFRLTAPLGYCPTDPGVTGLRIIGSGSKQTTFYADHVSGPAVAANGEYAAFERFSITSSATRTATGGVDCVGLQLLSPDVPRGEGLTMNGCGIKQVTVSDQPSHGYMHGPLQIMSRLEEVRSQGNGGHGFVFTSGAELGRTNTYYPGICNVVSCWSVENGGHGIKIGDPADASYDGTTSPLRFDFINVESANNCQDATKLISDDDTYIRGGRNIRFQTGVWGSPTASTYGAVRFSGEMLIIQNCRFVNRTHIVRLEEDPWITPTKNIVIDSPYPVNQTMDPAVVITDTDKVQDVVLRTYGLTGRIASGFTPGAKRCIWQDTMPPVIFLLKGGAQTSTSTTLADVSDLAYRVEANESLAFQIWLRYKGDAAAQLKISVTGPSGAVVRWAPEGSTYIDTSQDVAKQDFEFSEATTLAIGCNPGGGTRNIMLSGYIDADATAGDLKVRFAQNSSGGAVYINPRSWLKVYREFAGIG